MGNKQNKRKKKNPGWFSRNGLRRADTYQRARKSASCGSAYRQASESVEEQKLQFESLETIEAVKDEVDPENSCLEPSHEVDSAFSFIQNLKRENPRCYHRPTSTRTVQNLSIETEPQDSANEPQALNGVRNEKKGNNDLGIEEIASSPYRSDQGINAKKSAIHSGVILDKKNEKDGETHQQIPETKGAISAFTLKIIADILEKPVEELDVRHWEEKIKTESDEQIYKELGQLTLTNRRYKCFKCKAQIKGTVKDMERHMKNSHDSGLVFGCFFCPLARVTVQELILHEGIHVQKNQKTSCTICDSMYEELPGVNLRELHFQCHPPLDDIATYIPEKQITGAQRCVLCKNKKIPGNNEKGFIRHLLTYHVDRHLSSCKRKRLVHSKGPSWCENCELKNKQRVGDNQQKASKSASRGSAYRQASESDQKIQFEALETIEAVQGKEAPENACLERSHEVDSASNFIQKYEKDGKTHQQRPENKGPTSAFTLEIIADILEKPVEKLDVRYWEEKIKTEFDEDIFKEIGQLTLTKRRYKCFKCKAQIKGTVKDMEKHMKKSHNSGLVFGCFFCPLARVTEEDLIRHEGIHMQKNQKASCTICDSTYEELPGVNLRELHFQCHPPLEDIATYSPEKQITDAQRCVLCKDKKLSGKNQNCFIRHLLMYHVDVTAVCEICGLVMNRWKLQRHVSICKHRRLVHSQGPSKCENCDFTEFRLGGLQLHDCTGKFDCNLCDAKFVEKGSLKRHMKNIHSDLRKYVCHICGKGFQEPFNLQDHINTHTGEKPYQCLACGTRHTSRPGLAMHLRSWHNVTIREMKEKYKNCPVPEEPIEGGKPQKATRKDGENKEEKINLYTGRKIGRPRKEKVTGKTMEKGKTVKRSRKKKHNSSSDSDDDDDFLFSKIVDSEEEKKKTAKKRLLRSNVSTEDSEEGEEKVTKKRKRLISDFSGDDSEEKSNLSSNFSDDNTGELSCEQSSQKTRAE